MQQDNLIAHAFDFDKTLVYCYGDSDEFREENYGLNAKEWFYDITTLYKGVILEAFTKFKSCINDLENVYIITGRGIDDTKDEKASSQLISKYLAESHDIYLPIENIISIGERGEARVAQMKQQVIKQLIDQNDYLIFNYYDDKPTVIASVDFIDGYNHCKINTFHCNDWKKYSATQYDEQ